MLLRNYSAVAWRSSTRSTSARVDYVDSSLEQQVDASVAASLQPLLVLLPDREVLVQTGPSEVLWTLSAEATALWLVQSLGLEALDRRSTRAAAVVTCAWAGASVVSDAGDAMYPTTPPVDLSC